MSTLARRGWYEAPCLAVLGRLMVVGKRPLTPNPSVGSTLSLTGACQLATSALRTPRQSSVEGSLGL